MIFVALLRGINVGGRAKVEMRRLRAVFEGLGFGGVSTYINSGNVIFGAEGDEAELRRRIEAAIKDEFGLQVPVLLRSRDEVKEVVARVPESWTNDTAMKCDVLFLWPEIDDPAILKRIPHNPEIEDVVYAPGVVVWRIDRTNATRGQVVKIVGSELHKLVTVRNVNTVRKLAELMEGASGSG